MKRSSYIGLVVVAALGLIAARPQLADLQSQIDQLSNRVAGIGGREVVQVFSATDTSSYKAVSAQCPAGKVSLGGGGDITFAPGSGSAGQNLSASYPDSTSSWRVSAVPPNTPNGEWTLIAYAICGALQ